MRDVIPMYFTDSQSVEVHVKGYRYTPHGMMYDLEPPAPDGKWLVLASLVTPIFGRTRMMRVNLYTGEKREAETDDG